MLEYSINPINQEELSSLFGNRDENIRIVEDAFSVEIKIEDNRVYLIAQDEEGGEKARSVVNKILNLAKEGEIINKQLTAYLCDLAQEAGSQVVEQYRQDAIMYTARGKRLNAKTKGQSEYVQSISKNTITFGIGPAGTGKTYLAVAMAVKAFRNNEVSRIILTRPAVEAGEKLGFLPGDLQNKVDPYLRPLYDALYDIMGMENYFKNFERGAIEIAPLAYMRGRTLDDSFIILDEAQNTTKEQLKMFLTRIGHGSKVVVTGDITQIDLPKDKSPGLTGIHRILKGIEGIGFVNLTDKDVVRHELVQKIVKAYDDYENRKEKKTSK